MTGSDRKVKTTGFLSHLGKLPPGLVGDRPKKVDGLAELCALAGAKHRAGSPLRLHCVYELARDEDEGYDVVDFRGRPVAPRGLFAYGGAASPMSDRDPGRGGRRVLRAGLDAAPDGGARALPHGCRPCLGPWTGLKEGDPRPWVSSGVSGKEIRRRAKGRRRKPRAAANSRRSAHPSCE